MRSQLSSFIKASLVIVSCIVCVACGVIDDVNLDPNSGTAVGSGIGPDGKPIESTVTYTVGGTLNGLGAGETVSLQLNGTSESLDLDDTRNGEFYSFTTAIPDGSQYSVTVSAQPIGRPCWVVNSPGVVSGGDIVNADVTCARMLNDTGIIRCPDPANCVVSNSFPNRDGDNGRDVRSVNGTLFKNGAGAAGFDYTKISNAGNELPASAALGDNADDWACTRDNVTGLVWEVKKDDDGLRDRNWRYYWYNTDAASNGGNAGQTSGGLPLCATPGRCDTEKFIADTNASTLCGGNDWRLPTSGEFHSIVHRGVDFTGPVVDTDYFPNTVDSQIFMYWSSTSYAGDAATAWVLNFGTGADSRFSKSEPELVRLVRDGQ